MIRARNARVALLAVAVLATTTFQRQIPPTARAQQGEGFVAQPHFAKLAALGNDTLLADWYWIQAVLMVGGGINPAAHGTHLGRLVDVVTTLDPWVDHPYRFGAIWLTGSLDDVRHANVLLRRSFPRHPDEWRNRFYLGFNLFFYLDEPEAAADILYEASRLPGSPAYLPMLVARLRSEDAGLGSAEIFLRELLQNAPDDKTKAQYQGALDEIEVETRARALDRARAAFWQLHDRDIESIEDLVSGDHPILRRLPPAEPSSLPPALRRGSIWEIDPETNEIVSSWYGRRYRVHYDEVNQRTRRQLWQMDAKQKEAGDAA